MSRFDERLERDLRQIAERATPSPIAWTTIQDRIADQDPAEEAEIIMLTETEPVVRRRWPVLVAAACVVVALVVGLVLFSRDDESDERPASPAEVLGRFVEAFNAHDIDAVTALFVDDAVVNWPGEEAQDARSFVIGDMGIGRANTYEMVDIETTGDSVNFGHRWHLPDGTCYAGTDRMIIENAKIVRWDFITHSQPCPRSSPAEVLGRYVEAFNAHDIDAVMALFVEVAVISRHPLDPTPPAAGKQEIRSVVLEEMGTANTYEIFDVETTAYSVNFGHIWRSADGTCSAGTDSVIVNAGGIVRWDFNSPGEPCP